MKKHSIILIWVLLFTACDTTNIRFEQPQPSGAPNLSSIPEALHGTYFAAEDSIFLSISTLTLTEKGFLNFSIPKDSITQPELQTVGLASKDIQKDTTINISYDDAEITIEILRDSAHLHVNMERVIFSLNENNLLREKEKSYFFSLMESGDNTWRVFTLKKTSQGIIFNKSTIATNLPILKEMTPIDSILNDDGKTTSYTINPDTEALNEILKQSENSATTYIKIN